MNANSALRPADDGELGAYSHMNAVQRDMLALRFAHV
jgi:hypothetical protein